VVIMAASLKLSENESRPLTLRLPTDCPRINAVVVSRVNRKNGGWRSGLNDVFAILLTSLVYHNTMPSRTMGPISIKLRHTTIGRSDAFYAGVRHRVSIFGSRLLADCLRRMVIRSQSYSMLSPAQQNCFKWKPHRRQR
jgi:hypothetical protein